MHVKKEDETYIKRTSRGSRKLFEGNDSLNRLAGTVGIGKTTLKNWMMIYENEGPTGLLAKQKNTHYAIETKLQAVNDYLNGLGSLLNITKKYGLRSKTQLLDWIKIYNTHKNFKSGSGGSGKRFWFRSSKIDANRA